VEDSKTIGQGMAESLFLLSETERSPLRAGRGVAHWSYTERITMEPQKLGYSAQTHRSIKPRLKHIYQRSISKSAGVPISGIR
jgi:hypothetical protein